MLAHGEPPEQRLFQVCKRRAPSTNLVWSSSAGNALSLIASAHTRGQLQGNLLVEAQQEHDGPARQRGRGRRLSRSRCECGSHRGSRARCGPRSSEDSLEVSGHGVQVLSQAASYQNVQSHLFSGK